MIRNIITIMALLVMSVTTMAQKGVIYPDAEWEKAAPETYGFNSDKFNKELRPFIINKTKGTGVMIIVGGKCIFQQGALDRISYIASCRKSLLSMMYGKYVENGTINLNMTLEELGIDDIGGLLPTEKKATVLDLITSRSGCYHPASNSGDNEKKPERGSKKPGEYFIYNNWDFNVAFAVFEQLTGKNVFNAFYEDIGSRINIQDWNREIHVKGGDINVSKFPSSHFHFSTRDMARIGYLMLRKGNWKGDQLISEEWCKRITSTYSTWEEVNCTYDQPTRYSYGYMWWIFEERCKDNSPYLRGAYTARGFMGQFITVVPELDMVVAFKTDRIYGRRTKHAEYLQMLDIILSCKE